MCIQLTEATTGEGTFQYVEKSDQIDIAINSIAGSLGDRVIKGHLVNDEKVELRFTLDQKDQNKKLYKS